MKRIISMILILCLLMADVGTAFANDDPGMQTDRGAVLRLPGSLKTIGEEAFFGDTSLDTVVLPEGIKEIGPRAFASSSLKEINLPDSLEEIDDTAFDAPGTLTVTANEGTYAYNWAVAKGYLYEEETEIGIKADGFEPRNTYAWGNEYELDYYVSPYTSISFRVTGPDVESIFCTWWSNHPDVDDTNERSVTITADQYYYLQCCVCDEYGNEYYYYIYLHPETHLSAYPTAYSQYFFAEPGETVELSVEAYCDVPITYQWFRVDDDYEIIENATGDTYITEPFSGYQEYICAVTDTYGNNEHIGFAVMTDPHLSIQAAGPQYIEVPYGGIAELGVEVTCDEPVYYYWNMDVYDEENDWYEYGHAIDSYTAYITTDPITQKVMYECCITTEQGYSESIAFYISLKGIIEQQDGLLFRETTGGMTLMEYRGSAESITVPAAVDEKNVTAITDNAFAGNKTLTNIRLPKTILTIGNGAFKNMTAIERLVVPYGTVSIGSQAFANSSLQIIYIPDTVESIAADAFSGTEDITIRTTADSYAEAYADEYDYYCESDGGQYGVDMLGDAEELYASFLEENGGAIVIEEDILPTISTDGITDTILLASIEEINTLIEEVNIGSAEFADSLSILDETISSMESLADVYTLSYNDTSMELLMGGSTFTFYDNGAEGLGDDYEIISSETSEDGTIRMILESGGQQYLMTSERGGFTLSRYNRNGKGGSSKGIFRASFSGPDQVKSFVNWIQEHFDGFVSTYNDVSNQATIVFHGATEQKDKFNKLKETLYNELLRYADQAYYDPVPDSLIQECSKNYNNAVRKLEFWSKACSMLKKALDVLDRINPVTAAYTFSRDCVEFFNVFSLYGHGHPLDYERANPNTMAIVDEMKAKLWCATQAYGSKVILDAFDLVNTLSTAVAILGTVTVEGAPAAWLQKLLVGSACAVGKKAMLLYMKKYITETAIDIMAESWKNDAFLLDQILHESVTGYVYDDGTKQPLRNVTVNCDGITTRTDSTGFFHLGAPNGSHTLQFSKKGYVDTSEPVTVSTGMSAFVKVYMKSKAIIRGKVIDSTTGKAMSGVTVLFGDYKTTTNKAGVYSFEVEPCTAQLSVTVDGYLPWSNPATCEPYKSNEYNIDLVKKGIIKGTVVDAVTGKPVVGAAVLFGYWKTTTNIYGMYSFQTEPITAQLSVSKEGYITRSGDATCEAGKTKEYNFNLSKKLESGTYRVVLSWGANPSDLDAHLITANGLHIYYGCKEGDGAMLDIDDTTSYGPETITFTVKDSGVYQYYVHNYSGGGNTVLSNSNASVAVYSGDKKLGTYYVPSGSGNTWNVFKILNGEFVLTNKITN